MSPDAVASGASTQAVNVTDQASIARTNQRRYEYVRGRGHVDYCRTARRNEDFYLGGGLQWDQEVRLELESQGRPASEINEVMGAVNGAIGYQIANRMDVQFVARGQGADEQTAKALNLITKQILDQIKFRWHESTVWGDGLIQQRGYFDLRIRANEDMQGEIVVEDLDPMDVIPDPDAKSYDPDDWLDVIVTRWLTGDEIAQRYGDAALAALEAMGKPTEGDFGDGADDGVERARFGDSRTTADAFDAAMNDGQLTRYRVVDRQHHIHGLAQVAIYPTGEVKPIDGLQPEELAAVQAEPGIQITQRRIKRVRWTVSALDVLLFDDWSPYEHFTVIPFFPYFRRGRTRGMVDNAISPQETLNKAMSQAIHITNSVANSGWMTPQGALTNMDTEDLEDKGASTGLNVEYDPKIGKPEKIKPNEVPTGIVALIQAAQANIKSVTGWNESMKGDGPADMSGVAIQSRQFAAQQALAMPLDNLSRTRNMFATRCVELIQAYYSDERKFRITEMGAFGEPKVSNVTINQAQPDGSFLNDLTIGDYDVVISEQPLQITFDNSQFEQVMSMRKAGINIPDMIVVRYSNLADKAEVVAAMKANGPQPDPLTTAKVNTEGARASQLTAQAELTKANAELLRTEAVNTSVTGMYSATRAAAEVAAMPAVAPLADELLRSAGFVDKDAPPIVPSPGPAETIAAPPASESTNPLTPPHPDVGVNAGIEKPELPA